MFVLLGIEKEEPLGRSVVGMVASSSHKYSFIYSTNSEFLEKYFFRLVNQPSPPALHVTNFLVLLSLNLYNQKSSSIQLANRMFQSGRAPSTEVCLPLFEYIFLPILLPTRPPSRPVIFSPLPSTVQYFSSILILF